MDTIHCFAFDMDTKYEHRNVMLAGVPHAGDFLKLRPPESDEEIVYVIVAVVHICREEKCGSLSLRVRQAKLPV